MNPESEAARALERAAACYEQALPPGRLWSFPVTDLDQTGVPSWSTTLIPGTASGGHGYGWSELKAKVSALGELHERLQSQLSVPKLRREAASYKDLLRLYGEAHVIDPLSLSLPAGSPYTPDQRLVWTTMRRWRNGAEVMVPLEAAASSGAEVEADPPALYLPVSNGLGAHLELRGALTHALLELLQRDGNSVNYRALDQGQAIDLTGVTSPAVRELLKRFQNLGMRVQAKVAATDLGLVNLYVTGSRGAAEEPPIMAAACGEACHPDREVALEKALLEFAAARTRLAFNHGPLEPVTRIAPPGYLEAYRQAFGSVEEEARALEAMRAWRNLSSEALTSALSPVFQVAALRRWDTLPTTRPADVLLELTERLHDFDILYLELTTPHARDAGIHVVKAVVPGLEVETLSYGRLGVRNLQRLLERESPLVSLGKAPAAGARIRLPDEAQAALATEAWLDLAALDTAVGPLYPLYREPSRHAVHFGAR